MRDKYLLIIINYLFGENLFFKSLVYKSNLASFLTMLYVYNKYELIKVSSFKLAVSLIL